MPWYCWGTASRIQDLLADYIEAGAQEIMLCSVPNKPEAWQRIDEDVLSAFDWLGDVIGTLDVGRIARRTLARRSESRDLIGRSRIR